MTTLKEIFQGIRTYSEAHRVIVQHKLWHHMIIPGILSLCYIFLLFLMGKMYFAEMSGYVNDNWIPSFMKGDAIVVITNTLLWILLMLAGYITYKYVILIISSPFLSILSEATEVAVYHSQPLPFNLKQLLKDIIRGLIINIRNMLRALILTLFAWFLAFTPVIGFIVSSVLILVIQSYYDGFGLTDYTLERKKYSVRESIAFVRNNRSRVIGVGMGFDFMLMIPILGWFTAPAYGTVAATLSALKKIHGENHVADM